MLEQTLNLGNGGGQESLGAAGSWQEVRAAIVAEFKPTAELITSEAKPVAVAKQLVNGAPMRSQAPTLTGAVTEPTGELDPVGQADAARQVYERPVNIRTVELAATIEADGRVSNLSVLTPSGSSAFDDTAIAAVRRGLRDRAGADPGHRVLVRLRLSAGRAITLPRVVPLREPTQQNARQPTPRGLAATGAMQFDETTGAVHATPPLSNRLNAQVELISVTAAPPATAAAKSADPKGTAAR
jgi:TonB family protein